LDDGRLRRLMKVWRQALSVQRVPTTLNAQRSTLNAQRPTSSNAQPPHHGGAAAVIAAAQRRDHRHALGCCWASSPIRKQQADGIDARGGKACTLRLLTLAGLPPAGAAARTTGTGPLFCYDRSLLTD